MLPFLFVPKVVMSSHKYFLHLFHFHSFRALSLSSSLEKLMSEYVDLKHQVAESIINPARQSIEELQGELKIDLEKLTKFELAGNLELAKLRDLQLSLPSPPSLKAEETPRPSL